MNQIQLIFKGGSQVSAVADMDDSELKNKVRGGGRNFVEIETVMEGGQGNVHLYFRPDELACYYIRPHVESKIARPAPTGMIQTPGRPR